MAQILFERRIDWHAIAVCQAIGFVRHADNCHKLAEHRVADSRFARRRGMTCDAIRTAIGDAHRKIDELPGPDEQRSIRQSNNANESCTNDLSGVATGRSANLASGPEHTFVQPAGNSSTARFHGMENGVFIFFAITPPPLAACRLVSTCQQSQAGPAIVVW